MELDDIDKRLLDLLRSNARQTTTELARKLGLSRTTVKDRIARLESRGVISGYTIRSNTDYERGLVKAQVMIVADAKKNATIIRHMQKIDEVRRVYTVSGIYDFIVEVVAETTGQLDSVIDEIGNIDGVDKTLSSVLLSCKYER